MKRLLEAGKIVNTHGIRGEVKVQPFCDSAAFLTTLKTLYLNDVPVAVKNARVHKNHALLTLDGVDSVEAAMALKGSMLYLDRDAVELPEDSFFIQDILGFTVFDLRQDIPLGTLLEVLTLPASDVYVIKTNGPDILIPVVPEFVKNIDFDKKTITVQTIPGMGDQDEPN